MTKSKFKPCPFCGQELKNEPYGYVHYRAETKCPLSGMCLIHDSETLGQWNTRAPSPVLSFVANSLKAIHDNAWHYEEGYDETDICKTNIRALKAAGVAEYCGKWEEDEDGSTGTDNDKEGA